MASETATLQLKLHYQTLPVVIVISRQSLASNSGASQRSETGGTAEKRRKGARNDQVLQLTESTE